MVDKSLCSGKKELIAVQGVYKTSYSYPNRIVPIAEMTKKYRISRKRLERLVRLQGWEIAWAQSTINGEPNGKPFKAIKVR